MLEPDLQNKKDYNDYSRFINENNSDKKESIISRTLTPNAEAGRRESLLTEQSRRRCETIEADRSIKPEIMETRASERKDFFNLSDGFKRVFASNDRKDQRMVVPVCGYQGHRRGDLSHNFFGKNFREITIQSKFLERKLRNKNAQF